MRRLLIFLFCGAAAASAWGQSAEYFPLKPGTRKVFKTTVTQTIDVGGQSASSNTVYFRNTEEVVGDSKIYDKPGILVRTVRRDSVFGRPVDESQPRAVIENYYQTRPQGIFLLANLNLPADSGQKPDSNRYEPTLQVLKLPPDSGAQWVIGTMRMQGILVGLVGQALGWEDVETPGGSFKRCLKTKSSSTSLSGTLQGGSKLTMNVTGGEFSSTSWYAPGVGLVKQEVATRFVLSSANLPPGMSAELNYQQHLILAKNETVPKEEKKTTKK